MEQKYWSLKVIRFPKCIICRSSMTCQGSVYTKGDSIPMMYHFKMTCFPDTSYMMIINLANPKVVNKSKTQIITQDIISDACNDYIDLLKPKLSMVLIL